jgi:hypothetical protein
LDAIDEYVNAVGPCGYSLQIPPTDYPALFDKPCAKVEPVVKHSLMSIPVIENDSVPDDELWLVERTADPFTFPRILRIKGIDIAV